MKHYDENNIFAKIIRKEIPCKKIYEDDDVLCFYDINPQAKVHALLIPKAQYTSYDDFIKNANFETITSFFKKISLIVEILKIDKSGFRIISNIGKDANQEVDHFHVHILGGENLKGIANL